jgi:hypothetical protein
MPTIILDRQRINTNARHNMAEAVLLDDVHHIRVRIERSTAAHPTSWESVETEIQLHGELSFDGGQTWENPVGLTAKGGVASDYNGEIEETYLEFSIPPGSARIIRGWIDKTTGPRLQTWLTVQTEP